MKEKKAADGQIKGICKKYWNNSTVRRYYIDICMMNKEYDLVLQVLYECILLDKQYRGLISEYSEKKKEIYLLLGIKSANIEQLWKLVLEHEAGLDAGLILVAEAAHRYCRARVRGEISIDVIVTDAPGNEIGRHLEAST